MFVVADGSHPLQIPILKSLGGKKAPTDSAAPEPEKLVGKTRIAITNLSPRAMMGIESNGMPFSAVHIEEGEERLHLLMADTHIPAGAKRY